MPVQVFESIESTNDTLMAAPAPDVGRCIAAVADHQTAGRGRSGKPWLLPPGAGLCLSLAATLPVPAERAAPVTLAVGVGLVRMLDALGVEVSLKWPNDLVLADHKLGGILVERREHPAGSALVIGVGINIRLPSGFGDDWAGFSVLTPGDLAMALPVAIERDLLAARVIAALVGACDTYSADGLTLFMSDWQRFDYLAGRRIVVDGTGLEGTAVGINAAGELCVRTAAGNIETTHVGSISLP